MEESKYFPIFPEYDYLVEQMTDEEIEAFFRMATEANEVDWS